jgi:hypothetical protein
MYRGRIACVAQASRGNQIERTREYSKTGVKTNIKCLKTSSLRSIAATASRHHKPRRTPRLNGDYLFPLEAVKCEQGNDIVVKNTCKRNSHSIGREGTLLSLNLSHVCLRTRTGVLVTFGSELRCSGGRASIGKYGDPVAPAYSRAPTRRVPGRRCAALSAAFHAASSIARARARRDITVPIGTPAISAISR